MNLEQYKKMKEQEIDALKTEVIYVSPETLFKKSEDVTKDVTCMK